MKPDLVFHPTVVTPTARAALKAQTPLVIWFTGLSGAGKSTIANGLEQALLTKGRHTFLLDGDNVRLGLCRDLGFSDKDREENIRRIAEVSKLFLDSGLITIASFISPFRQDRKIARDIIGAESFIEVFIDAPLLECEKRDPKGLYKKARAGSIKNFTGIDSIYEQPLSPEVHIDTFKNDVEQSVRIILDYLEQRASQ
ncbi:adenylyl-sulfate kinase [Pseudomonas moraviensis]|uniref:Adenylyl-sulfate kinase n=1 Tax=Pseudomonas moraviensis TaxID=321662 RepID=A0A2A2PR60_9PSED|nr:adenylyl-sulfate kinase [Pseudomonas moraviensis]PAW51923.1 adenylyl-sulfate kinase [Pseudomonas moraviensis]PAW57952.1 adenylyl-sulfate kinase [Pseudomonas moraviensis]